MCQPQALPAELKGKTLFPTVNYKNYSLHLNFGPEPCMALPFKCRMVQDAAKVDTDTLPVVKKAAAAASHGKGEVIFPIALPDEGTFDWLDGFLQENPRCTE